MARSYVSRAHPQLRPKPPLLGIRTAVARVLDEAAARQRRRERKAIRNLDRQNNSSNSSKPTAAPAGKEAPTAQEPSVAAAAAQGAHVLDETIEASINLNVDPRKPNQSLRGTVELPHGSGKPVRCLVFTSDPAAAESLRDEFATAGNNSAPASSLVEAGGEDLVERILSGQVSAERFDRGLATSDIQPRLGQRLARILGPRGLMPSPKAGTLLDTVGQLREAVRIHVRGSAVPYRTDREGIVHVRVGRISFGRDAVAENVGAVMKEIFRARPESYGKGAKKASKNAKYLLGASLCSTQGKGHRVDPRTLDPTSPFFLNHVEGEEEEGGGGEAEPKEPAAAA
jgi:large subunit ribosomal protein L1